MTEKILGVDIDSTIWDSQRWYAQACRQLGVVHPGRVHVTEWYYYEKLLGKQKMIEMFNIALDPKRLYDRPMYPRVEEALDAIREMGVRPHFITHNANPDKMRPPVKKWLADLYGDVGLSVFHFDTPKLRKLKELEAFGMVDDRADFIIDCAANGLWAAAKLHPHNYIELAQAEEEVFVFETWDEIPPEVEKGLRRRKGSGGAQLLALGAGAL